MKNSTRQENYIIPAADRADAAARGAFNLPKRITGATARGTYDGRELTRTCDRPNSYDAYDKPSLMGTRTIYPRGAVVSDMM